MTEHNNNYKTYTETGQQLLVEKQSIRSHDWLLKQKTGIGYKTEIKGSALPKSLIACIVDIGQYCQFTQ